MIFFFLYCLFVKVEQARKEVELQSNRDKTEEDLEVHKSYLLFSSKETISITQNYLYF